MGARARALSSSALRSSFASVAVNPVEQAIDRTFAEGFEDGDVAEYAGDTTSCAPSTNQAKEGSQSLQLSVSSGTGDIHSYSGLPEYPAPGKRWRFWMYHPTDNHDASCWFGHSSGTDRPDGYTATAAVRNDKIHFRKWTGQSYSSISDSVSVPYSTKYLGQWIEYEVELRASGEMRFEMIPEGAVVETRDTDYAGEGLGWAIGTGLLDTVNCYVDKMEFIQ